MNHFDVLILGAGAAGLMCAIEAGKRGKRVLVLERNAQAGRKILISGGGRCNFTNIHCQPHHFLSANPHFAKSALARYTPADFIQLVEKHRIPYREKKAGQLFCEHSASAIVEMLLSEARSAGVRVIAGCTIGQVEHSGHFEVTSTAGIFSTPALVVATGGLSIPKMGATGLGYSIAKQFGLRVLDCRPALTPLVLNAEDRASYCDLAGVSAEAIVSAQSQRFREKMLITHRGLSGPAILQISSYWAPGQPLTLDLAPDLDLPPSANLKTALAGYLPARLLARWLEKNAQQADAPASLIHRWTLQPAGAEGYEKAEVTAGGVDTAQLSSQTMEARSVPGLFFIGEVVDVTGHLGGFNFQWAWSSGFAAGNSV